MLVIPSLELGAGLSRADAAPLAAVMAAWEADGFCRLQLYQRRRDRLPPDRRLVEEILRDVHLPVQVAGGNESEDDIDATLSAGASFAVLGSRALDDPDWLASTISKFPEQLLVTTPLRERRTRSRGAVRTLPLDLRDLAGELGDARLAGLIIDFAAEENIGPAELALVEDIAEEVGFPVFVSGGSPELATLRDLEFRGIFAAIIDAAHLSAAFDGQTLARSFSD